MPEDSQPNRQIIDKLLDQRTVLMCEPVMPEAAERLVAQLLYLNGKDDKAPIHFFLNTPGGSISDGFAIFDAVRMIKAPVTTICTGMSASMGTILMLSPTDKKRRVCLPNTRFMIHQPLGGVGGQATDIEIEAEEMMKARARLNGVIAKQTGQPLERVEKDTDRNFWMSPTEAKDYGIVGKIISSYSEL